MNHGVEALALEIAFEGWWEKNSSALLVDAGIFDQKNPELKKLMKAAYFSGAIYGIQALGSGVKESKS